jgi:photosystem II stability/assembly factor-like uncharacterized protein
MKKQQFVTLAIALVSLGALFGLLFWSASDRAHALDRAPAHLREPAASPNQVPTPIEVQPDTAPNDLDTPITITGTQFEAGARLQLDGTTLDGVTWISPTRLDAVVPWGLEPGVYTMTVTNPGGASASLANAFTVTQAIDVWNAGAFYGGRIDQLVVNPLTPTTLYAVSEYAGLFRSRDGGASWSLKIAGAGNIARTLAIDPLSPNRLYLFEAGRSDDEGDTWTPLNLPGEAVSLEAFPHPLVAGTVYAADHFLNGCSLCRSTDSGQTWVTIGETAGLTDTCVTQVAFHPTDTQTVVAGTLDGRIFHSADGGESWAYASKPDGQVGTLAFNPSAANEVWVSGLYANATLRNSNEEYTEWAPVGEPVGSSGFERIVFAPLGWGDAFSQTVFVAGPGRTPYKSTDGGATWQPFGPQAQVRDIALHPTDPNTIYASSACGGVYKTLDGGATWQQVNQGLTAMVPLELATVPGQPDVVYSVVDHCEGIFEGTQGGGAWQFLAVEGATIDSQPSMLVDPHTPTRLYRSGESRVYRSDDGGHTWPISGTLPLPDVCSGYERIVATVFQADPGQPGTLLAGAHVSCNSPSGWLEIGDIYRSTDHGETWATTLAPGQIISPVTSLAYDHLTPTIAYAGTCWGETNSGMWKSVDGGQSWQPAGVGVPQLRECIRSIAAEPEAPYRLFAGISSDSLEEHTLYVSMDHGTTWQRDGLPVNWGVDTLLFAPGDPPVLYAATDRLLHSMDGGQSWTQAAGLLGEVPVYSLAAVTAPGRVIVYAGTTGGYVEVQALNVAGGGDTLVNAGVYRYTTRRNWNTYLPLVVKAH